MTSTASEILAKLRKHKANLEVAEEQARRDGNTCELQMTGHLIRQCDALIEKFEAIAAEEQ